jgi:hypothetical protein
MMNAVFWDVLLCRSCVAAATCSRWFLARGFFYPEDGGDTFLRNVSSHKIYTAPHLRRRHFSFLPNSSRMDITINGKRMGMRRLSIIFTCSSAYA